MFRIFTKSSIFLVISEDFIFMIWKGKSKKENINISVNYLKIKYEHRHINMTFLMEEVTVLNILMSTDTISNNLMKKRLVDLTS
jgi:hypothetical protein